MPEPVDDHYGCIREPCHLFVHEHCLKTAQICKPARFSQNVMMVDAEYSAARSGLTCSGTSAAAMCDRVGSATTDTRPQPMQQWHVVRGLT